MGPQKRKKNYVYLLVVTGGREGQGRFDKCQTLFLKVLILFDERSYGWDDDVGFGTYNLGSII